MVELYKPFKSKAKNKKYSVYVKGKGGKPSKGKGGSKGSKSKSKGGKPN